MIAWFGELLPDADCQESSRMIQQDGNQQTMQNIDARIQPRRPCARDPIRLGDIKFIPKLIHRILRRGLQCLRRFTGNLSYSSAHRHSSIHIQRTSAPMPLANVSSVHVVGAELQQRPTRTQNKGNTEQQNSGLHQSRRQTHHQPHQQPQQQPPSPRPPPEPPPLLIAWLSRSAVTSLRRLQRAPLASRD